MVSRTTKGLINSLGTAIKFMDQDDSDNLGNQIHSPKDEIQHNKCICFSNSASHQLYKAMNQVRMNMDIVLCYKERTWK